MAVKANLLRGKRMRLTRLDECGNVPASAETCAYTVTKGFITVTMSPEYEDGDEFVQKNADGDLCLNETEESELKRINLNVELCGVDFSVVEIMTGDELELDYAGEPVGVRSAEGKPGARFAMEIWTGVGGDEACQGGTPTYGYFLLPFVQSGKIAELSVENGPINFTLENAMTKGGGNWGTGPWDVIDTDGTPTPGPLLVPMAPNQHRLARLTTIAPPAETDGCQDMP
jgi:hypothetical protein